MARRPGRPKTGHEPLTRERILTTALRLVDEHGVEALSMRRLAGELGVDPMAIYHHLPGREALLAGLVELVFAEFRVPATGAGWRDQIRAFGRAYRDLARAHPHLVLHIVTNPEVGGRPVLEATEGLYQALEAAGLTPGMIVRAADLIVDYLNGFALAESSGLLGGAGERAGFNALLEESAAEHFVALRRVYDSLDERELRADFEAGLEIILAGIAAIAEGSAGTATSGG